MARDVDANDLSPASPDRSPERRIEEHDVKALVRSALAELPAGLREAVVLRDLQEFSYLEIAEKLRLPEGTVKSRINRGRLELARQITRLQERPPVAKPVVPGGLE